MGRVFENVLVCQSVGARVVESGWEGLYGRPCMGTVWLAIPNPVTLRTRPLKNLSLKAGGNYNTHYTYYSPGSKSNVTAVRFCCMRSQGLSDFHHDRLLAPAAFV
jgi:hypothetical protein